MKLIMLFLAALLAMLCFGCSPSTEWRLEYKPITQEERDALRQHIESTLCPTKRDLSLSGHDQDLDDYATVVYDNAAKTVCQPRMFEYTDDGIWPKPYHETGRWRPVTQEVTNKEPPVEAHSDRAGKQWVVAP